ncbi:MAG: hypothetical protein HY084_08390 [Gemmatimonadetes bacterium]|nr:hypothetical protein [Gemmatimonadota bacterium]
MNRQQQSSAQTLSRAQQFLDRHADVVGAINQTDARRTLDAAVAATDTTVTEQGTRVRDIRGETHRQSDLEAELVGRHMVPIAKFARAQLTGVPNFAALIPNVNKTTGTRLYQAAMAMAAAAQPYAAQFPAPTFAGDFITRLRDAAVAVKHSVAVRADKRVQRIGATTQLARSLAKGRTAVLTLDALLVHVLHDDPRLAEEWRVAKRIGGLPGRTKAGNTANAAGTAATTPTSTSTSTSTTGGLQKVA